MKRKTARKTTSPAKPPAEYDFSKGVTGKYAVRYWESVARAKMKRPSRKPA